MVVECSVIMAFFVLIAIVFIRGPHKEWALAVLPLILVPLTDVVLDWFLLSVLHIEVDIFGRILSLVIAVAASAAWVGVVSQKLKSKKTSITYIVISNAFDIALAAIIINNMLKDMIIIGSLVDI